MRASRGSRRPFASMYAETPATTCSRLSESRAQRRTLASAGAMPTRRGANLARGYSATRTKHCVARWPRKARDNAKPSTLEPSRGGAQHTTGPRPCLRSSDTSRRSTTSPKVPDASPPPPQPSSAKPPSIFSVQRPCGAASTDRDGLVLLGRVTACETHTRSTPSESAAAPTPGVPTKARRTAARRSTSSSFASSSSSCSNARFWAG
mmetsp:Transcript_26094/g.78320  ORF Transcript_26094/g.78320 Transcript_26094/m.78320 type:complete len:207 (-) Transcript_26094:172-792(-)